MNYHQYQQLFEEVLHGENRVHPYNDHAYLSYTESNRARMKRWDQELELEEKLLEKLKGIGAPQHWIIITEPWCGDASHIIPFLVRMTEHNSFITCDIQLRDSEPFLIGSYLTNGAKSIPKLVVRDANGRDVFNWGPRPGPAQQLMDELKAAGADLETLKTALHHWYAEDKGVSLCGELTKLYKM